MSRYVLALAALGFTLAPLCAAEPRPLWEIEVFPDDKGHHPVRWVGFSADGKTLAAQVEKELRPKGLYSHRFFAWDRAKRKQQVQIDLGDRAYAGWAMFANATTKTGSVLVAGNSPEEIRLSDGVRVAAKGLESSPIGVWFDADRQASLWLMEDGFLDFSLAFGKTPRGAETKKDAHEQWLKAKLPRAWTEDIELVAFAVNPDLTRIALSSREDRKLMLSSIAVDGKLKLTEVAVVASAHKGWISSMCFSPDGKTLATGSADSSVCLWDVGKAGKDWKPRATVAARRWTVVALAFSPDGRTLAAGTTGGAGENLFLIDVASGKLLASHQMSGAMTSLAYSRDGKALVTGSSRGQIKAWDAEALRNP